MKERLDIIKGFWDYLVSFDKARGTITVGMASIEKHIMSILPTVLALQEVKLDPVREASVWRQMNETFTDIESQLEKEHRLMVLSQKYVDIAPYSQFKRDKQIEFIVK
jgi:hypothetical protein